MTQPQCDGQEKHSHYVIDSGKLLYHTHKHLVTSKEFNRLHHHSPLAHDKCTPEELNNEVEYLEVPF